MKVGQTSVFIDCHDPGRANCPGREKEVITRRTRTKSKKTSAETQFDSSCSFCMSEPQTAENMLYCGAKMWHQVTVIIYPCEKSILNLKHCCTFAVLCAEQPPLSCPLEFETFPKFIGKNGAYSYIIKRYKKWNNMIVSQKRTFAKRIRFVGTVGLRFFFLAAGFFSSSDSRSGPLTATHWPTEPSLRPP